VKGAGAGKPRLLYLGHNLPFPPHEGALIRSYHTLRLLSQFARVSALFFYRRDAIPTEQAKREALDALSAFGKGAAFPIKQEYSWVRLLWDHFRSVTSRTAYTRWAHESRSASRLLSRWIRETPYDLVHVDSLDLMEYLPRLPDIPVVLAHHNVESQLLLRRAEAYTGLRRRYIRHQARLVEKAERYWCEKVDLNVVVSSEDGAQLREVAHGAKMVVVPNGVDTGEFTPSAERPDGGIAFVGGQSWFPNADGMSYFAKEILPLVRSELPDVSVKWVGKAAATTMREFAAYGIEMLGYVDDIRPELHRARLTIVPLRVGGGTRLKILDAWALGKAVVSTTVGCEGLDIRHGENILIADGPADFAGEIVRVFRDEGLRRRLESGGRKTAVERYDWNVIGRDMCGHYRRLLDREDEAGRSADQ
jgi:glycosyltransferase involved in cell wall biosynthesis